MRTAEDIVNIKGNDMLSVNESATIYDALTLMIENKIGAILVHRDGKIVGMWTERDLMRNTLQSGFNPKNARIGDYMITGVRAAPASDSVYLLMDKFLGMRVRYLLIEKEDRYIGLLSTSDVFKAILHNKIEELKELNAEHSWEYYEEWQWKDRFNVKVDTPGQPVRTLNT